MQYEIVERSRNRVVFDVEGMPPLWCLTLRNVMMYSIPTLKMHLITVDSATDTALDAQQWANRLGHIALDSMAANNFLNVEECDCALGCDQCEATLSLYVNNTSQTDELVVYSDDLIGDNPQVRPVHRTFAIAYVDGDNVGTTEPHTFSDGDLVTLLDESEPTPLIIGYARATRVALDSIELELLFADDDVVPVADIRRITKRQVLYYLAPGQSVSITAKARKGIGKQHVKWSPIAGNCSYRPLQRGIAIDNDNIADKRAVADACPQGVFDIEDNGNLVAARIDDCNACGRCMFVQNRFASSSYEAALEQLEAINVAAFPRGRPSERVLQLINEYNKAVAAMGAKAAANSALLPTDSITQLTIDKTRFALNKLHSSGQAIRLPTRATVHRFTVETNGSLPAIDVVLQSFDIVEQRLRGPAVAASQHQEYPELQ